MSLFNKAQTIYQRSLEQNKKSHESLKLMNITSGEYALKLQIGWIDGKSFKETLTKAECYECVDLDLFSQKHVERKIDVLSLPLFKDNKVTGFATWRVDKKRKYLICAEGIINEEAMTHHESIILVDSPHLYCVLRHLGFDQVVCYPFLDGSDYLKQSLTRHGVKEVFVNRRKKVNELLQELNGFEGSIKTLRIQIDYPSITKQFIEDAIVTAQVNQKEIKKPKPKEKVIDNIVELTVEDVTYKAQILSLTAAKLKVILTADMGDMSHTDKIDLYIATSRRAFSKAVAERFVDDASVVESDLHQLIKKLEEIRDSEVVNEIKVKELSEADEVEAKKTLLSPNVLDEWLSDCRRLNYVGEDNNLKIGFMAVVSRLLENPLSIIFKSSPASGKSHLLNLFCSICPPEKLLYSSKLTTASLYYSNDLKNKLVAVDESSGSSDVLYPLRSLISSKKLVLTVAMKEPNTGATTTKQTIVHGPIAYMESTTGTIHPENLSRAILLSLDESKAQSLRILESQRQKVARDYSDSSELIFKKWRNVQRLLAKCAKPVVIPFVDKLRFPANPNSRRDFQKFLSLIQAVTLLRVLQRPTESDPQGEYICANAEDYRVAYDLYSPLMINPQDELSERAREFLTKLQDRDKAPFNRRQLMEDWGLSYSKVQRCITELVSFDILGVEATPQGQPDRYVLMDVFIPEHTISGLTTPDELIQQVQSDSSDVQNKKRA